MLVWGNSLNNFMLVAGTALNFSALQNGTSPRLPRHRRGSLTFYFDLPAILGGLALINLGFALRDFAPSVDKQRKHELQTFSRTDLEAIAENLRVPHHLVQRKALITHIIEKVHTQVSPLS